MSSSAVAQSSPSAYTTGYRWDPERRLTGIIAPEPSTGLGFPAQRFTFDADGKLIRTEKGVLSGWQADSVQPKDWAGFTLEQRTDYAYDSAGYQTEARTQGSGTVTSVTQMSVDDDGRPLCTAIRMNLAALPAAGGDACAKGAPDGSVNDRITKTVYDLAGQALQERRAVGTTLEQAYATYAYSPNGKRTVVVDANGNRAEMGWDGFDRQASWTFPSAARATAFNPATPASALATSNAKNTNDYEAYDYDANGNRVSFRKRDARLFGYTFDVLDRLTIKAVPKTCAAGVVCMQPPATAVRDVYYGYDLLGRQLYARFDSASGEGVGNVFDAVGRLSSSTLSMDSVARTLSYEYDANGNRTRLTFPDTYYFDYDFDVGNRMVAIRENGDAARATIGYDGFGRRNALSQGVSATSYAYDAGTRLQSLSHNFATANNAQTLTFEYNPASQIVSRTGTNDAYAYAADYNAVRAYQANGLNQYSQAGPRSWVHDANGNTVSTGPDAYAYDAENRLIEGSGAHSAKLRYDPLGRLYELTSGGVATRFLYDTATNPSGIDALVGEYDGRGMQLRRYLHGPGADEPLLWYEGATLAELRTFKADHQGSVVAVVGGTGDPFAVNRYDEWGLPDQGNQGRFQYTGQIWLPDLALYHYKARAYLPKDARFLQSDPVGYQGGLNLYSYVANDPVNHTDPTGLECSTKDNVVTCKFVVVIPAGQKSLTPEQRTNVNRFERNYIKSMQAISSANKNATVGSTGGRPNTSFKVRGSEVGKSLYDRVVTIRPGGKSGSALLDTGGNPVTQTVFTNVYGSELGRSNREQMEDIAHDGIHSTLSERLGNSLSAVLGSDPYQSEHQEPYNKAANDLLPK